MKIDLSENEIMICKLVKGYALSLSPPATPRLAGGFVRDKIMGIKCHDIDIALDNISGLSFATGLSDQLKEHPNVHKILANPDKSKHLETAVINIHGYSIDFVHLRSEQYTDSRIPIIKSGTPEEDAFRRDITINSLFYNLITEEIEDFTRRGLNDIQNKSIDTPLDPKVTLFDDPLRILRIFRFKSRFEFNIHNRIYEALKDERLAKALKFKVSNERNGIEIMKMVQYKNGEDGLIEIIKNNLISAVFKQKCEVNDSIDIAIVYSLNLNNFLEDLIKRKYVDKFSKKVINTQVLRLYTVLQLFVNIKTVENKQNEFINVLIMKDALKTKKEIFYAVQSIEENVEFILENELLDIVGLVVKCKEYWIESLLVLYLKFQNKKYYDVIFDIFDQNYHECYLIKPLINGNFLVEKNIDVKSFKEYLFKCHVLQIKNPKLTANEIYEKLIKQ